MHCTMVNASKEPFHLFIYCNSQCIKETSIHLVYKLKLPSHGMNRNELTLEE